jgi:hypothetical protein
MKKYLASVIPCIFLCLNLMAQSTSRGDKNTARQYYQIRIYQLKSALQEQRVSRFLENAYLPALRRAGFGPVGVFAPVANDTAPIRKLYVLIPLDSLHGMLRVENLWSADAALQQTGADYLDANHSDPPYERMETILLQAFPDMPRVEVPALTGAKSGRIYELRSYEGATEKIHQNKVTMFNAGGEIPLFRRLGFNAVFYAEVIAGSHMPNLMYMTSFDDMAAHDAHWKTFGAEPEWKQLSGDPQYQNNVSHIDIVLLHPEPYSEL